MTLTRAILNALKTVPEPFLLSEEAIHCEVNVNLSQPVTLRDINAELSRMATQGLAKGTADAIDRVTKWKLTNEGRLA